MLVTLIDFAWIYKLNLSFPQSHYSFNMQKTTPLADLENGKKYWRKTRKQIGLHILLTTLRPNLQIGVKNGSNIAEIMTEFPFI